MKHILFVGCGGHFESCEEIIKFNKKKIKYFFDIKKIKKKNYIIYNNINILEKNIKKFSSVFISVGLIYNLKKRERIISYFKSKNFKFEKFSSKNSIISHSSKIGDGTIIMNGAIIGPNVSIGENCVINTGAIVEHGSKIEDNTHISTGSIINGNCHIGKSTFVGSNSVIKEGTKVKKNSFIKMKSCV